MPLIYSPDVCKPTTGNVIADVPNPNKTRVKGGDVRKILPSCTDLGDFIFKATRMFPCGLLQARPHWCDPTPEDLDVHTAQNDELWEVKRGALEQIKTL